MINKKSILILAGILVAAYASIYFYTANMLNTAILNKLDIEQERIVKSGFPFNVTFKIKEHDKFKKFSYNLLSKKIELGLNFFPKDIEDFKFKKYNIKDLEHLKLSAKLGSYFDLKKALKNNISELEAFNLANDFQLDIKASTAEPDLFFDSSFLLSFPGKRKYETIDDFKSDFPRIFSGSIKYNIDADLSGDAPSFVRKISELAYPETVEISFEARSSEKLDFNEISNADIIKTLLNLNLKFRADTNTKIVKSKASMDLKAEEQIFYADIKVTAQYKGNAVKNLYNSLSKEDVSEFALLVIHDAGLQLSDNTKQKITMLTDLIWDRLDNRVKQNPDYMEMFNNLKTNYIMSLKLPANSEVKEDAKILIHIPNDSGSFELKLDGVMQGGLSGESIDGQIFVTDNDMCLSEVLGLARLVGFTIDKTITSDSFGSIVGSFDEDMKTIALELKSFTDNPESKSSDLVFTYKIDIKNPMASTISKSEKNILEFVFFLGGLFASPMPEQANIPDIDEAIPPVEREGADNLTPPAEALEGLDL